MITPKQSKGARAFLDWTQSDLSNASGISKATIVTFENGTAPLGSERLRAVQRAFEESGVVFPDVHTVRMKHDDVEIIKGPDALQQLWNNIFFSLKDKGGEVLITNVDEKRTLDIENEALLSHLERLKEYKIRERLLCCKGDTYFLMPPEYYRWISKELFTYGTSSYIYDGKVAMQIWGSSMIVLIHSEEAYEAEKRRFEYLWKYAEIPKLKSANSNKK